MTTASNTLQDRRQRAAELLDSMAAANKDDRNAALRNLAAQCLGLSAVNRLPFAVKDDNLPGAADIIAEMPNDQGYDIITIHFDLSETASDRTTVSNRVSNTQAQAANAAVQQQAGAERTPLLIFTLPDHSGVQFSYGEPEPGRPGRLLWVSRLTYRWGEHNRTTLDALERIGQEIASGRDVATGDEKAPQTALADGFKVQPVTDAFFQDYKDAYAATAAAIASQITPAEADVWAQTLFNRLLFVHFISKKGWLSYGSNSDYLNALWADYQANPIQTNFYADRLDPLFHGGMNTPEPERDPGIASIIGQVPYLNGGLFERNALDRLDVTVGDHIIEDLLAHDGLFNSYNFTVTEATPLDTEVAVDPEMLGKLFEETVNARHSNGAYYTPRPVVAFMCRQALKGYLSGRDIRGLSDDKIADLVDNGNAAAISMEQAIAVAEAVAAAKILDPACGSGAFLLGTMQEILALNASLFRAGATPEILYRQKLNIISRNLHGADKDASAVSIAMLRLWLSLAVDYEGEGVPPTLPNLDLKLAVGDALTGPDPQSAQGDFMAETIRQSRLDEFVQAYGNVKSPAVKERLRDYIAGIKAGIRARYRNAARAGAVEWRVDFADVNQAGGFDIVIANPPYVRQEEIAPKSYKDTLLKAYADAAVGRSDLYCYFYARGLQLLKEGGMHLFVCSNSWLDVGYGAKLQEYLLDNATVDAIYESAVERQFSTAAINTIISVARKGQPDDRHVVNFVRLLEQFEKALKPDGNKRVITKTAAELRAVGTDPDQRKPAGKSGKGGHSGYVGDKWGGKYLRAPDIYHHILDKYGDKLVRLGDIATVRFGIKTGANEFFYLKPDRIKEFGIEDEFLAPVMTSPTESQSVIVDPATLPYQIFLCHKDKADLKGTGTLAYIEWAERNHQYHTRPSTRGRRNWYDLGQRTPPPITINRIIDQRAKTFTLPGGTYSDATLQEIHCPPESATAIAESLNDDFSQVQYNIEGRANFGGGALELKVYETEKVLLPDPNIVDITTGGGQTGVLKAREASAGGGFEGTGEPPSPAGEVSIKPAMLSFGYIVRTSYQFFAPQTIVHTDANMHVLWLPEPMHAKTATSLNSTLTMLMAEYSGRKNMTGLNKIQTYELARLMVPNPVGVTAAPRHALTASDHALVTRDRRTESGFRLTLTDTRRMIDAPVFDYLGLTQDEQGDLYNAAYDAIVKRQTAEANVS